jgi:hypothetical protein
MRSASNRLSSCADHRARTLDLDAVQPEQPRQLPGRNAVRVLQLRHLRQQVSSTPVLRLRRDERRQLDDDGLVVSQ